MHKPDHGKHAPIDLRVTTLGDRPEGSKELGVVYASVEGVNEHSFDECVELLKRKGQERGAKALIGLQLVQSQFQWNQRTSLIATAIE